MSGWLTGWRLSLRMARRDAMKARGRSALVLVMIALPVLAVTAAVVAQRTTDVSPTERLDRTLGAAQARITVDSLTSSAMLQSPDGDASVSTDPQVDPPSADDLAAALGGVPITAVTESSLKVESDDGVADAEGFQLDLADPLVRGLVDLRDGRLPRSADEVVVNRAMLDEDYAVGDALRLPEGVTGPTIVGVAESSTFRDHPLAAGPAGSLPAASEITTATYLVGGGPVSWSQVQQLNALGATVVSRAVVLDPPPDSEIPEQVRFSSGGVDQTGLTVAVLVVTMALLEVVLLAGPAFAVGTRRLQRSLALMAAAGGTPQQARRVVLAGAVVLGSTAAMSGVLLGVGLAAVILPVLQHFSGTWFGPFDVPVLPLVGVAGFGLLSAFLAAVVPAWIASRQDVVAVLAGRRGDAPPSFRSPVAGLVLVVLGVVAAAVGSRRQGSETLIAGAALLAVLGMILLVPLVVSLVARASGRFPLSLRYAARDAARHRTRTAPAVAAVAATVAGVVALLIANTSDAAENKATYTPSLAAGIGVVSVYGDVTAEQEASLRAVLAKNAPGTSITEVYGTQPPGMTDGNVGTYTTVQRSSSLGGEERPLLVSYGSSYGTDLIVSDGPLPPGLPGLSATERTAITETLGAGGLVAFTDEDPEAAPSQGDVYVSSVTSDFTNGDTLDDRSRTVAATLVHVPGGGFGPAAVMSPQLAQSFDVEVALSGLAIDASSIDEAAEQAINEGVSAVGVPAGFYVERGYQAEDETLVLQLILLGLGAVLMLGGTLTATFLALSDALPDLATLAAVGASPRRRRGVAAGYALVVGFVGAVLGAAVGFVPGLAIAFPLTFSEGIVTSSGNGSSSFVSTTDGATTGPFIDVPWLMILALVVVLPLVTAALVALTARSRLPLVARLD